jgi:predicted transglutaminase-like cysteine proteinase
LLGGAPSALDAIRAQQGSLATRTSSSLLATAAAGTLLTPGIDASKPMLTPCNSLAAIRPAPAPGSLAPLLAPRANPEDFLASKRVQIGRTSFDEDWQRVRGERLSASVARRHLGPLVVSREQSLSAVNRWANQRIRYAEDRDQYGVSDFWAGARKTLKAGKGDCEDIALVKLQLLAAVGVPREDMILTIARDLVRNADHAVLIVRTDAGWRMLDNATDEVLDAGPSHDYRAILSFGSQGSWLHGV